MAKMAPSSASRNRIGRPSKGALARKRRVTISVSAREKRAIEVVARERGSAEGPLLRTMSLLAIVAEYDAILTRRRTLRMFGEPMRGPVPASKPLPQAS